MSWLASLSISEVLSTSIFLAGFLMGFLYFCFSWRGKLAASSTLRDDLRVRGLLWGLSSAGIVLIADWQKFVEVAAAGAPPTLSKAALMGSYLLGFLCGTMISIVTASALVVYDSHRTSRAYENIFIREGLSPLIDFFLYGHKTYQDKLSKAIERHRSDVVETSTNNVVQELKASIVQQQEHINLLTEQLALRRRLSMETSEIIISAIDTHRGYVAKRITSREACKGLLKSMISIVAYYTIVDAQKINANYMTSQARADLSPDEIAATKFMFGEVSRYDYFLTLKDHARRGTPMIRLPVEPAGDHDWHDRTLPGAPEAFLRRQPTLCNVKSVIYAKDIPDDIRVAQSRYLRTQPFDTIISLPIMRPLNYNGDGGPIGVLNFDLSLDGGSLEIENEVDYLKEMEALVSPCNGLLADILSAN